VSVSEGFDITEYTMTRKYLKDAGYKIAIAGPSPDRITGSDGATSLKPKTILTDAIAFEYDALIFVGPLDLAMEYKLFDHIEALIFAFDEQDSIIAGICGGVGVLNKSGILEGKNATTINPSVMCTSIENSGATCTMERVERDGNIITAQGPETAKEFGIILSEALIENQAQAKADEVSITILYDNTSFDNRLTSDWGFSALIKYGEHTILFDTGYNGEILKNNADLLGADLTQVDVIVLSHEHLDHIGGLDEALKLGITPPVYAPEALPEEVKNDIRSKTELITVTDSMEIFPGVHSTGQLGSAILEQGLILKTAEGSVLITGCAHPGIMGMVRETKEIIDDDVAWVMGGFHLGGMNSDSVADIAGFFQRTGVGKITPTHCTGELSIQVFASEYGEDYVEGGAGQVTSFSLQADEK